MKKCMKSGELLVVVNMSDTSDIEVFTEVSQMCDFMSVKTSEAWKKESIYFHTSTGKEKMVYKNHMVRLRPLHKGKNRGWYQAGLDQPLKLKTS